MLGIDAGYVCAGHQPTLDGCVGAEERVRHQERLRGRLPGRTSSTGRFEKRDHFEHAAKAFNDQGLIFGEKGVHGINEGYSDAGKAASARGVGFMERNSAQRLQRARRGRGRSRSGTKRPIPGARRRADHPRGRHVHGQGRAASNGGFMERFSAHAILERLKGADKTESTDDDQFLEREDVLRVRGRTRSTLDRCFGAAERARHRPRLRGRASSSNGRFLERTFNEGFEQWPICLLCFLLCFMNHRILMRDNNLSCLTPLTLRMQRCWKWTKKYWKKC